MDNHKKTTPKQADLSTDTDGPTFLMKIVDQRARMFRYDLSSAAGAEANHDGETQEGTGQAAGGHQAPPPPALSSHQRTIRGEPTAPGAFSVAPGQQAVRRPLWSTTSSSGSVTTDHDDDEESLYFSTASHRTNESTGISNDTAAVTPLPATLVTDTSTTHHPKPKTKPPIVRSSIPPSPEVKVEVLPNRRPDKILLFLLCVILVAAVPIILWKLIDSLTDTTNHTSSSFSVSNKMSRLERIKERGALRCAYRPNTWGHFFTDPNTGEMTGFDTALCEAVAAAILGPDYRIEYVESNTASRFHQLTNDEFDIYTFVTAHTMSREIYEVDTQLGFEFTVPYMYNQVQLGGDTFFIENCVDQGFRHLGDCAGLKVCVPGKEGSFGYSLVSEVLPGRALVLPNDNTTSGDVVTDLYHGLLKGTCNVIIFDSFVVAEPPVRQAGYLGSYKVAEAVLAYIPYSIVTARGDPVFSDLVNAVVLALQTAEASNITQQRAHELMPQVSWFGDEHKDILRNAIAAGGNFGEIYSRHLKGYISRGSMNDINDGSSGLLYPLPFKLVENQQVSRSLGPALTAILNRGYLRCGVQLDRPGFAMQDSYKSNNTNSPFTGMDIDYCKAISASLFEGAAESINFMALDSFSQGFKLLAQGQVDVITGAAWTLENDFQEPTTGLGFSFSQPYFYQDDGENVALATMQDDPEWAALVYWIVEATFYAEQKSIFSSNSSLMPEVNLFGSDMKRILRDAILMVGSYSEMYERNLESTVGSRSKQNMLNKEGGPQFYVPRGLL
ncbi:extracellular solute-binding protein [Seminavis robusta]|uniref:Extracellular solute-binding protein n=1 Tax=Seminavis robusta TaxID=568900 RepID=A0A9N8EYB1_9STRA|nr:extracellular solute-binding protein [Seminavis robusta]|eukprot:Sro2384_g325690.1 extracellular solute-binding protein (783) ;mRNA; r:5986-8517